MLHHIDFAVRDRARSRRFYAQGLAPLGLTALMEFEREDGRELVGFGSPPDPEFWIRSGEHLIGRWCVTGAVLCFGISFWRRQLRRNSSAGRGACAIRPDFPG